VATQLLLRAKRKIPRPLAMTDDLTLTGQVLPVRIRAGLTALFTSRYQTWMR
jgi:ATP-dependent Lon protease